MNTLDQLLADTAHVDDPPNAEFTQSLAILDAAIAQRGAQQPVPLLRERGTRRRRLSTTVMVAVGAAAVIAVPIVAVDGVHTGSDAAAANVLRQAGQAAGSQQGGWPDARYWHVASTYIRGGHTYRRDIWFAHDGESVLHDRGLPGHPGVISLGRAAFDAGPVQVTWDQLYSLPTDPAELARALHGDPHDGSTDSLDLFGAVADLLRETPAPPALREALYGVLAKSSAVQNRGTVTDPLGRVGTVVEHDGQTLIIDTSTGELLDDTEGTGWSATYIYQGPADSAPALTAK